MATMVQHRLETNNNWVVTKGFECFPFKIEVQTQVGNAEVVPRGLEPRTLRSLAVRSNQLSYETRCTVPLESSAIGKFLGCWTKPCIQIEDVFKL